MLAQSGVVLYFFVAFESDVSRKMSSVGECSFGMVMREDFFFTELFFLDGTCLGKVIG